MAAPLADRIRPQTLDDVVGQEHLLAPGMVLRRMVETGSIPNLIFYGPSGVGKTTVASIIAKKAGKKLVLNCRALAKALTARGFRLISGGSDNHLVLLDLRNFGITGKDFEKKLDEVYITVNKNAIPNDPQSPFITSGVRVGTPAVTSRGFVEADMEKIAEFFYLTATDFENKADEIRAGVEALCAKYPLYE